MHDVAERWLDNWSELNCRHVASRDSQGVVLELARRYRGLSVDERRIVDGLLRDALSSDVEWQRFDALTLIDEFKIVAALPALEQLSGRLAVANRPGAPFELKKVLRIIDKLSEPT